MPVRADRPVTAGAAARPDGAAKGGEIGKRIASASILAPLGLLALYVGGPLWAAVVALAAAGAAFEWGVMCRPDPSARALARALLVALCVAVTLAGAAGLLRLAVALLAAGMVLLLVWRSGGGASTSCGAAYVALPSLALVWLRAQPAGLPLVLLLMLTVWASDTGAFVAGRVLGGPRLAPAVSPSKTWSGAAGGLVAACLVGAVFAAARLVGPARPHTGPAATILVAGLLGLTAQVGDLVESAAKRRFGVKDSGRLIPGHGGLLDRLDGLMAAAPVAAALLLLAGAAWAEPHWMTAR